MRNGGLFVLIDLRMFPKTELESSTSLSHIVSLTGVTFYLVNTTLDIYFDFS